MRRLWIVLIAVFINTPALFSQIFGVVNDSDGNKPLSQAQVFINKTSLSSVTNENGEFSLHGIAPGFVELIVYKKGYEIFKSPIRIQQGKGSKLNLKLIKSAGTAADAAPGKPAQINEFFTEWTGKPYGTPGLKIMNPKDIRFSAETPAKLSFKEPIVLENTNAGYVITGYFGNQELELKQVFQKTSIKFDTLIPKNPAQLNEWNHQREEFYFGSRQHFFWSLANMRNDQGFEILNDSGSQVPYDSIVRPSKLPGYKRIVLNGRIEIRYHSAESDDETPSSTLAATELFDINVTGMPLNEKSFEVEGAMVPLLANQVPVNYFPLERMGQLDKARSSVRALQEKIYVHTDKPYYYPGEVIWLKGYVDYFVRDFSDSLSKVMFIEFISPEKEVLVTRTLKIDSGFAMGDFVFPDSLKAGNYYLRAYTNLMRSFGDGNLFVKTLPIIGIKDKVEYNQAVPLALSNPIMSISADKQRYKIREKIKLKIKALDSLSYPVIGNFSMAVTDEIQVVPIAQRPITDYFPITSEENRNPSVELDHIMDSGISFGGQFFNDRGKKEKTTITLIQGKFENVITLETNATGGFFENGYDFYDSMEFRIQGKKANGNTYGKVEISKREIPEMDFNIVKNQLAVMSTNKPQRVISEYEVPHGAKVLQEVNITSRRVKTSDFVQNRYGTASRIIGSSKFFGTDMASSLLSAVPGLRMNFIPNATDPSQSRTFSLGMQTRRSNAVNPEPLIYVDDVFRGGGSNIINNSGPGAVACLVGLIPSQVDHVEIISTPNMKINIEGGSSLIAIYMKAGFNQRKSFDIIKIPGYYKPRIFSAPDYESLETNKNMQDLRSTLYWNPSITTDATTGEASVSFFASDLAGKYRIVIEGMTSEGQPLHAEEEIEVVE